MLVWVALLGVSPLLVWTAARAESQEMSAARNRQAKAYQDYYQRLRQGGALGSAEKRKEAYDATVGPAERDAGSSLQREFQISSKNAYRMNRVRLPALTAPTAPAKTAANSKAPDETDHPKTETAPAPDSYRPETVLDGSGVPREIEFGGSKKK